jgi:capsid assembly protease
MPLSFNRPSGPTMRDRLARLASNGLCSVLPPHHIEATLARIDPRTERAVASREGSVALVNVRGVICPREDRYSAFYGEVGAEDTVARIAAAVADPGVKAVVVAFDSPGGNVSAVPESCAAIRALRGKKPIIAQADFTMASAAYWLALGCDEICAASSAGVGSVGVIAMGVDETKYWADMGIVWTAYAKPDDKADGWGMWADSEKFAPRMRQMIDETYAQFIADVIASRPSVSKEDVQNEWAGFYNADRAKLYGMIDKVRTIQESFAAYTANTGSTQNARNTIALLQRKGTSVQ